MEKRLLDMNRYQWTVLLAAWLGWGFDVFDSLLFNYVAPTCVPTLLGVKAGTPEAQQVTIQWVGWLTSMLLIGWGLGGIIFGRVADRIGRTKTLLLTMLIYALGTAACAFAPNIFMLALFRFVASLGIGGEWAAGAAMVAEVVPEKRRVEAGALLYTAAPLGLFLASFVTKWIQGSVFVGQPEVSWRYVFAFGLIPAVVAFLVRLFVKEPEAWKESAATEAPAKIKELFAPPWRRITLSGLGMAFIALVCWWSCNAFIPTIAAGLAQGSSQVQYLNKVQLQSVIESWKAHANNMFNFGGLIGTLLTIPFAKHLGRRVMYASYFLLCGLAIIGTFGLNLPAETRLNLIFFVGLAVFGVFGSFTYYLPELYPTRMRATGSGFCYNAGRFIAAGGPFLVAMVAKQGIEGAMRVLVFVGVVPLLGLLLIPVIVETRTKATA